MTARPGEVLGGCRVVEKLGEGTLSEVYRAVQSSLGRDVAVKILKASVSPSSQLGARFSREASRLARMAHQNIPQVYDAGTDDGRPYLVLELVEGRNLAILRKKCPTLPSDVAALVALKLARALEHAHLHGIVHRDLKPGNVLVSDRGEVKLTDFGLAQDLADPPQEHQGAVGTPAYMSPEQVLGDRLDYRSDVFSFGIVLYELLTGRRPFEEEPARTVMQKIRLDRYVPPRAVKRDVPTTLERILARCLEKNPKHRYPSTGALCDDLNEYLARAGVLSHEARLIAFLRDVGEISPEEAERALGPTAGAWSRRGAERNALRRFAAAHGAFGAGLALAVAVLELSQARSEAQAPPVALGPRAAGTTGVGYLRVLARPWAELAIDGTRVDTTPTATAFPLAPGSHHVRLSNPAFVTENRTITVSRGATVWVDVDLVPVGGGSPRAR